MSATATIRHATPVDVRAAAAVITRAFHDLPQSKWLVGSALLRPPILWANMRMWVEHALEHGVVDVLGHAGAEIQAVAVWFDLSQGPIPLPDDYDRRLDTDCGVHARQFRQFDLTLARHHPQDPHHHLALLAVEPVYQHHGLGTALVDRHHEKLDTLRLPGYLEASTPDSARLYERLGYRAHGEPYALPDDGPLIWPMWRHALV